MRIRTLLSAAVLAALLAGCGAAPAGGSAASVDGQAVPRERLEEAVQELTADGAGAEGGEDQGGESVADTQRRVLTFLIQAQIIQNLADERGIEVSDEDARARYEEELENFGGEEALADALAGQGLTVALYRDVLVPISMRLDVIRDQFAEEVELEEVEVRTTRHILVETEDEAQAIVAELADGADFAELAQERSTDPGSGAQGGDLGANPRGVFVPEFDEAAWSAEIGEVVGPVESQFGFHIIEVTDIGTSEQGAGGADPQQLAQQQVDALLAEAFGDADVSIGAGLGDWDAELQQVVESGRVGEGAEPAPQGPDELLDGTVEE